MTKRNGKQDTHIAGDKSTVVAQIPMACADETAAVEFFEQMRFGGGAFCPRMGCGSMDVYQMMDREGNRNDRYLWRCRDCKRQFTVRIGTVLEDSRIPLRHWAYAFWAACSSKKGVSALQIKRQTGLSYKSALFLMHRIRWAMADSCDEPLTGTVEVDETYVGGKPRHRGDPRNYDRSGRKAPVMALVERGGDVRAMPIEYLTGPCLKEAIRENVDVSARIVTDEWASYKGIGDEFEGGHETVHHGIREYVRGDVYTNTVEGFFALLKRGIIGTFHQVSKKHLHRYVDEFAFRYNTRKMDDGQRTALAMKKAVGKRLRYREPVCDGA